MAAPDPPLIPRNFRVRLTVRGPRGGVRHELELPFVRVELPQLRLDGVGRIDDRDPPDAWPNRNLVLRRGVTGSSELFDLWRAARDRDREQLRDVTVVVLDDTFEPVVAWRYSGCHIVALDHSPLDALAVGSLTESLEVSFKAVEEIDP